MGRFDYETPRTLAPGDPADLLAEAERLARFGIWRWDIESGIVHWSDELHRIYGLRPGEFAGSVDAFLERVHPDDRTRVWAIVGRSLDTHEPFVFEERIIRADGAERILVSQGRVITDADGAAEALVGVCHDITERAKVERALGSGERRERLEWSTRIRAALDERRLLAYAEPIVSLETGEQTATELLVRMRPDGNTVAVAEPDSFLPAAERYGLVQLIDAWMIERALELAPRMTAQVNVSAVTLCDPQARDQIAALLAAAPDAARRVVFEITETADMAVLEAAREFALLITRAGARVALDDFGVGFGSFTYLRSLPVSFIKIDRSFIRGLTDSIDDNHVVKAIIGIAREFGLWTIAEGVEDEQTLELVRRLGVNFAQGFHLGRPAPLELD